MRAFATLRADVRGVTIVEFAIILPAMLSLICGAIEFGHMMFARVVLEGAVTEAARAATATLETKESERTAIMRASIAKSMGEFGTAPGRSIDISTTVYRDFSTAFPETFTDANGNKQYDKGEPYVDRNKNGMWDNATPVAGNTLGGPGDVVSYTVKFPKRVLFGFVGSVIGYGSGVIPLSASTVVRNEAVVTSAS
ncbi:TadE family protein [Sphingomonas sp. LB3N6]|uniref:TadE/TadG family type IV pilus assembly protein n=1 Tax=Sphingomonas fucosidasi TaxID=3096164 RepID=UPI002FCAAABB